MRNELADKHVLLIKGSLLCDRELSHCLTQSGAKVSTVTNLISAFTLLDRARFDAAIIDQGQHNAAFDLCTELQSLDVPYLFCNSPNKLQGDATRHREANKIVAKLADVLSREDVSACPRHGRNQRSISGPFEALCFSALPSFLQYVGLQLAPG